VSGGCDRQPLTQTTPPILMFGRTGMGPLEFNYPRAIAIGAGGALFIVDKAARIQSLSQAGEYLNLWTTPAQDAGRPTGLGVDAHGRVYAADTHYSRVLVYAADGRLEHMFGTYGDGPGQLRLPTDVAVAPDGSVYVSEYGGNDRVSKFNVELEFVLDFGHAGDDATGFRRPQSVVIAADGTIWVADACNHRVSHFAEHGQLLGQFGRLGGGIGELRFPYGLDLLSDGTLVVCEYGNNRVQRFTPGGRSLGVWGTAGRSAGQLAYPWALAVAGDDRVFVVDSGNNRIQVIDGRPEATWARAPMSDAGAKSR